MKITPTDRILRRARHLIRRHGWVQRMYKSMDGEYCVVGAIREAADQLDLLGVEKEEACHHVARRARCACLPDWNDAPGRTKKEVLEVLR